MFCLCRTITAAAAAPPNAVTGQGSPSSHASSGREHADRMEATDAYRVRKNTTIQSAAARSPTMGATPRIVPPAVATALPPVSNRRKIGLACPTIAAPPASTPASDPATCVATSAGTSPFAMSKSMTGTPYRQPNARQTFVAPMLPLPVLRMSSPRSARTSQYPVGMLPAR